MQEVINHLVDDTDGSPAAETIRWSFEGADLTIDLSELNAETLRAILAPYVAASRRVGAPVRRQTSTGSRRDLSEVRGWLSANGWTVPARGRISAELLDKFDRRKVAPSLFTVDTQEPVSASEDDEPEATSDDVHDDRFELAG